MTGKCRAILEAWHEFFEQENANNPLAYSCANLSLKKKPFNENRETKGRSICDPET